MRVLDPGHRYALRDLRGDGETVLQFQAEPPFHERQNGPSSQEVIRALIERTSVLHAEKPWAGNLGIIMALRRALVLYEVRALQQKVRKGKLTERQAVFLMEALERRMLQGDPVETYPVRDDGHLAPMVEAWTIPTIMVVQEPEA